MTGTFEDCVKRGLIKPFPVDGSSIERELAGSAKDLNAARANVSDGEYLWAIVQSYYSMFHAARAILYHDGYREKSHQCIEIFLKKLVSDGRIDQRYVDYFSAVRHMRELANYDLSYSLENAEISLRNASDFNDRIRTLIK